MSTAAITPRFDWGARLLTTGNPDVSEDEALLDTLGLEWGPRTDKPPVASEKVGA